MTLRCPRCASTFDDEAGADAGTCDRCGTELVSEGAPPVARAGYTELTKVHDVRTEAELSLARALLRGADIAVFIADEDAHLRSGPAASAFAPKRLLVPAEFAKRAAAVLREHGVLKPVPPAADELDRLWTVAVVPALAGGDTSRLLADLPSRAEAFRSALFGALEASGDRGLEIISDLALALAARGSADLARESAGYLAACEAFRDRRPRFIGTLGALVRRGADVDLATRVIAALERFRGSADAERALLPLLEHADATVRDAAFEALFSVSGGATLGYEPDADPLARAEAVQRWWDRAGGRRPW